MVKLRQAGGHLSASGSWGGDDDQRSGSLYVIILAKALFTDDMGYIVGVAVDSVMAVDRDSHVFQLGLKNIGGGLAGILGDDHASHVKSLVAEGLDETQDIHVIGDAQIVTDFIFFNIRGIDDNDDFRLVGKLHQHLQFAVRCKAGQNTGSVVIVK